VNTRRIHRGLDAWEAPTREAEVQAGAGYQVAEHCDRLAVVPLLADLYAFLQERQHCSNLAAEVEGDRVWTPCTCGAAINRTVFAQGD
jgi:hypothetical protein